MKFKVYEVKEQVPLLDEYVGGEYSSRCPRVDDV